MSYSWLSKLNFNIFKFNGTKIIFYECRDALVAAGKHNFIRSKTIDVYGLFLEKLLAPYEAKNLLKIEEWLPSIKGNSMNAF